MSRVRLASESSGEEKRFEDRVRQQSRSSMGHPDRIVLALAGVSESLALRPEAAARTGTPRAG